MNAATLTLLLFLGPLPMDSLPFSSEQQLQQQTRRREQLHHQLRILLASPDLDVQRVGLVFYALGKYDPRELLPLMKLERVSTNVLSSLAWREELPGEVQDELIRTLADRHAERRLLAVEVLEDRCPHWRDRAVVAEVAQLLVMQVSDPVDDVRTTAGRLFSRLGHQAQPALPKLFRLIEDKSQPTEVRMRGILTIPESELGPYQLPTCQLLVKLIARSDFETFRDTLLQKLAGVGGPTEEREIAQLISAFDQDFFVVSDLLLAGEILDRSAPGWRSLSPSRTLVTRLTRKLHGTDGQEWYETLESLDVLGALNTPETSIWLLNVLCSENLGSEEIEPLSMALDAGYPSHFSYPVFASHLTPEQKETLLQRMLELSRDQEHDWFAFCGLEWMATDAAPAVPVLLKDLESRIKDWESFAVRTKYVSGLLGALVVIDPHCLEGPAGRRVAEKLIALYQEDTTEYWNRDDLKVIERLGKAARPLAPCLLQKLASDPAGGHEHLNFLFVLDELDTDWQESEQFQRGLPQLWDMYHAPGAEYALLNLERCFVYRSIGWDRRVSIIEKWDILDGYNLPQLLETLHCLDPGWNSSPILDALLQQLASDGERQAKLERCPDQVELTQEEKQGKRYHLLRQLCHNIVIVNCFGERPACGPVREAHAQLARLDPDWLLDPQVTRVTWQAVLDLAAREPERRMQAFGTLDRLRVSAQNPQPYLPLLPDILIRLADLKTLDHPAIVSDLLNVAKKLREQDVFAGPVLVP